MEQNRNCNRSSQNRCFYNQGNSVKYTTQPRNSKPAGNDSCPHPTQVPGRPVGMAYIPEQAFENIYDSKCGLMEGTMFKDLNLIFCGVRGKQI